MTPLPLKLITNKACGLDHMQSLPVYWIDKQQPLNTLLDAIKDNTWLALDTEFIKRDTYYPRLALIQINTGDAIYLLDAQTLDLTQFWQRLSCLSLMIWHACSEDLGIFYLLAQCPPLTNVFDTQIALAFLTGQLQMGYQQAVKSELDVELDKAHSQSDWLARPLSKDQQRYAADDVRFLPLLYERLIARLQYRGWEQAVWQECQHHAFEVHQASTLTDNMAYLSMADYRYNHEQMAVLQAICAWRESLARATNQPRPFILRKQAVREIVTSLPSSIHQLNRTSVHRHIVRTYGDELLAVIAAARKLPAHNSPASPTPPYRSKDKTLSRTIKQLINDWAKQTQLPPAVLMRKKWLASAYDVLAFDAPTADRFEQLSANEQQMVISKLPPGLIGWRLPWVREYLLPILYTHQQHIKAAKSTH